MLLVNKLQLTARSARDFTLFTGLLLVSFTVFARFASAAGAEPTFDLGARTVPAPTLQLKLVVEVAGELKLNPEAKEVRRVPVAVDAAAEWQERSQPGAANPACLRQYRTCRAKLRVNDKEVSHELRPERHLISCQLRQDHLLVTSPSGPMSREELELMEVPFQSLVLPGLLPSKAVTVGDSWTIPEAVLQAAFNLDAINEQQSTATLKEVKDDVALIEISGRLSGASEGVSSDVDFKAKINVNLKTQLITWVAASIREHRAVGHARPGFETVTKLRLLAEPCDLPGELSDEAVAQLPKQSESGSELLELASEKGGYSLLYDRRWRRMTDRHDVAVMRMVDQGDLIAQCNISSLPALPKGQQLTLDGFQQDISRGLGNNFEQFVEATQQLSDDKSLAIYRVVAVGKAQEIPIQWVHFYFADSQGHRASIVITLQQKVAERFAAADRQLAAQFRFLSSSQGAVETSQKKAASPR